MVTFAGLRQGCARPTSSPNLRLGRPNDRFEQEADSLSAAVMNDRASVAASRGAPISIQRDGGGAHAFDAAPASVDAAVRSPADALDSRTRAFMEPRFGHRFGHVRVHTGPAASASAAEIGALAYTVGTDIVMGAGQYQPRTAAGQRLLSHELTHIVQQAGARNVVRRYTAYTAADQSGKKSLGWTHPSGKPLRVSDDGLMVVEDNGWGKNKNKRAWTTTALIDKSNAILAAQGSVGKLVAKGTSISGAPPSDQKGAAITLEEIVPQKSSGTGDFELAGDCGSACKQVTGSGPAGKDVAVLKGDGRERYTQAREYYAPDPDDPSNTHAHTTPEDWAEEVFKREFGAGLTRAAAYKKYSDLSPTKKQAFDKKYGINLFATPRVGQGLTVSTEIDMPGFKEASNFTWNFHYAATVLTSGRDYVTLENAAGWKRTDWIFFMYGPVSKGQTFHEFHGATKTHGSHYTTMVVQPSTLLDVKTKVKDAPMVLKNGTIEKLPIGTSLRVLEQYSSAGVDWMSVEVSAGALAGKTGDIRQSFIK